MDTRIDVNTLLVGDKNALMYAARITGYGAAYDAYVNCSSCGERFEWCFDLSKYDECFVGPSEEEEGATYTANGTLEMELPVTKAVVELRAITGEDESFLTKAAEMKRNQNLPETGLTDLLKAMLVSANGVRDRGLCQILSFYSRQSVIIVAPQKKRRSPSLGGSFGLGNDYIKGVYNEMFLLKYHGGWGFTEAYNLPIQIRRWFLKRLQEQFDQEKKQAEKHSK